LGARFLKLGELGRGGMAVVYRVRDVVVRKDFALKVMNHDLAGEATYLERFDREAEAMRHVQHERIVEMIDVGTIPSGQPYIKMPIMKNGSLQECIVRPGGCSDELVRGWAADALEALVQVHAANIVHRDIKPSNFLLSDDSRATLTDFGIALGANDQRLTRTLDQMGTVQYMAPEQRTNRTVEWNADIFSLAVVLHELRTGELPLRDPGVGIDGQLGELIRAMGAASPSDRPTAADALRMLREGQPLPQPSPPPAEIPARKSQKKRGPSTTGRKRRATPAQLEAERAARAEALRQQEAREKKAHEDRRLGKIVALAVLAFVFMLNYVETAVETWLRTDYRIGVETEQFLAEAAHWFEGGVDFVHHDATTDAVALGFSLVYFVIFPAIAVVTVLMLMRMRDSRPLLILSAAATVDYAISLPFFLFFPVPERWAYPASNAILMSDLLTTRLIQAFRPISGLNNCFPSFHVSATVVLVLCLYRARVPFRHVTVPLGLAIILSTFALGIHWTPDIIAGVASGIISIWAAERLLDRLPTVGIPFLSRLVPEPS
jgi:serine/threonine protein kinase